MSFRWVGKKSKQNSKKSPTFSNPWAIQTLAYKWKPRDFMLRDFASRTCAKVKVDRATLTPAKYASSLDICILLSIYKDK